MRREGDGVATWEERTFVEDEVIVSELLRGLVGTVAELWPAV